MSAAGSSENDMPAHGSAPDEVAVDPLISPFGAAAAETGRAKPGQSGSMSSIRRRFSSQSKSRISTPTNVTHVTHVGWSPQKGFELRNLPDEWKQIFKAAGVRRSDLTDPETARMIVTLIAENMIEGRLANMPLIPGIGQAVAGLSTSRSAEPDAPSASSLVGPTATAPAAARADDALTEWELEFASPDPNGYSIFGLTLQNGRRGEVRGMTVVGDVAPGSIAQAMGVRVGDVLVSVNDEKVQGWGKEGTAVLIESAGLPVRLTLASESPPPDANSTATAAAGAAVALLAGPPEHAPPDGGAVAPCRPRTDTEEARQLEQALAESAALAASAATREAPAEDAATEGRAASLSWADVSAVLAPATGAAGAADSSSSSAAPPAASLPAAEMPVAKVPAAEPAPAGQVSPTVPPHAHLGSAVPPLALPPSKMPSEATTEPLSETSTKLLAPPVVSTVPPPPPPPPPPAPPPPAPPPPPTLPAFLTAKPSTATPSSGGQLSDSRGAALAAIASGNFSLKPVASRQLPSEPPVAAGAGGAGDASSLTRQLAAVLASRRKSIQTRDTADDDDDDDDDW